MYCECGCGGLTSIVTSSNRLKGRHKGLPTRFIPGHNRRVNREVKQRYKNVFIPTHPKAFPGGSIYEHTMIVEKALGRHMPRGAQVHHVDEDTHNNKPGNLVLCENQAYHMLLHARARIVRAGGNPNSESICAMCKTTKVFEMFYKNPGSSLGVGAYCRGCSSARKKAWRQTNQEQVRARKRAERLRRKLRGQQAIA